MSSRMGKRIEALYYDGSNGPEVLEMVQQTLGLIGPTDVWSSTEDESGLVLTVDSGWGNPYPYPAIPVERWVVLDTEKSYVQWFSEDDFYKYYSPYKDIFLAAANDPEVIDALRTALGLADPEV